MSSLCLQLYNYLTAGLFSASFTIDFFLVGIVPWPLTALA